MELLTKRQIPLENLDEETSLGDVEQVRVTHENSFVECPPDFSEFRTLTADPSRDASARRLRFPLGSMR